MKKALASLAIAAALVLTLGSTTVALAQGRGTRPGVGTQQQGVALPGTAQQQRGSPAAGTGTGYLADYLDQALADALGLSLADFKAARDSGLTFVQIALEQGYDFTQARDLMVSARTAALDAAVADGVISADQAEWMNNAGQRSRMGSRHSSARRVVPRIGGQGLNANGTCPNGYVPGTRWAPAQ